MNPTVQLTAREREVVGEIVAGRNNCEMAELGIKEQAVKNVLSVVDQKCHLRNGLELAVFALKPHLLPR